MKFCSKCGNKMEDDMIFCSKCGTQSRKESANFNNVEKIEIEPIVNKPEPQQDSKSLMFTYKGTTIDLQKLVSKHGKNRMAAENELNRLTKVGAFAAKKVYSEACYGKVYNLDEKEVARMNKEGCFTSLLWVLFLPIMIIIKIII